MYRPKDRQTPVLFPELFPLGGRLRADNRWIKLAGLVPWESLEEIYRRHFSKSLGRPAKDARLICGLLIVKHWEGYSDERVVEEYLENPYVQALCGEESFVTDAAVDPSLLSKMRKRLGPDFFKRFESRVLDVLKERRIVKAGEHLLDATVAPVHIEFPTDTKILNRAREWAVGAIGTLRGRLGIQEKIRTYCRKARWAYLGFQKKRRKTKAAIRLMRGKLLRYLRRNVRQLETLLETHGRRLQKGRRGFMERLGVVKAVYRQQYQMWKTRTQRVKNRIVSLHLPHIRPIVRGKDGKDTEFGPKILLSWVDGLCFLDRLSFDAYNEASYLSESLEAYRKRFGKYPACSTGDGIFGSRANRAKLKELNVRGGFRALGRSVLNNSHKQWLKAKQKLRSSRMEGIIGYGKNCFGLDRILYRVKGGEEMWVRLGLLAMNLSTTLKRMPEAAQAAA